MQILHDLTASLTHTDIPVTNVCAGAFWTTVTSRFTGMSSTYRELDLQHSDHPCMVRDAGELTGKTAGDLAAYALSDDTVSASLGMAAINSLIAIDEAACRPINAYEVLAEKGAGKNIGVVGHFPFIPKLRELAANLWVIERRQRPGDYPESDAEKYLPRCDVVCLTSTSFINHTIGQLLGLCRNSFIVLTGPTTPMTPLLFDYGIDVICGSKVTDAAIVNRYITQGATFRQVKKHGIRLLAMTASS
ncbi:MAG: hypothetical protein EOM20_03755 [Spartobacteria bacterium]|nr:hypothetical protein [Spartobacteria bacterium]